MRSSVPEDLIPLFAAAAIAYEQLFGRPRTEDVTPSTDELDLVALVLANHLHFYGRTGDRTIEIPTDELRRGMFWGGAKRFESMEGDTIIGLAVSQGELAETLSTLSLDSL